MRSIFIRRTIAVSKFLHNWNSLTSVNFFWSHNLARWEEVRKAEGRNKYVVNLKVKRHIVLVCILRTFRLCSCHHWLSKYSFLWMWVLRVWLSQSFYGMMRPCSLKEEGSLVSVSQIGNVRTSFPSFLKLRIYFGCSLTSPVLLICCLCAVLFLRVCLLTSCNGQTEQSVFLTVCSRGRCRL